MPGDQPPVGGDQEQADAKPVETKTEQPSSKSQGDKEKPDATPVETEIEKPQIDADNSGATTTEESSGSEDALPQMIAENQAKKEMMNRDKNLLEDLWTPTEATEDVPYPWHEFIAPKEDTNVGDATSAQEGESRQYDRNILKFKGPHGEAYHPVITTDTDAEGWFYSTGWDRIDKTREGGRARERLTDKVRRRIWRFGEKLPEPTEGLDNRYMFPQLKNSFEAAGNFLGSLSVAEVAGQTAASTASAVAGIKEAAGQTAASISERTTSAMAGMKEAAAGQTAGGSTASALTGVKEAAGQVAASTASAMAGLKDTAGQFKLGQLFSFGGGAQASSGMPPPAAEPLQAPKGGLGMPAPAAAPLPAPGSSGGYGMPPPASAPLPTPGSSGMSPPAAAPLPVPGSSGMPPPAAAPLPVPGSSGGYGMPPPAAAPLPTPDGSGVLSKTDRDDEK